jgi:hypothetical protein
LTSGPKVDPTGVINVGVAAHITAAASGGPRYDPSLTAKERRGAENGIWLCQTCAKLIDSDLSRYTAKLLREWKELAEQAALTELQSKISPREMGRWIQENEDVAARLRSARLDAAEAHIIDGLVAISSQNAREDKLIIEARASRNVYVQFASECKDGSVYGEAVCNEYLDGDEALSDEQIRKLVSYGWEPPGSGYINFHREWKAIDSRDLKIIALEAIRAFSDVYKIDSINEVDLRTLK